MEERQPAVAGRFYPGDAKSLEAAVRELVGPDVEDERAIAVVAPHAGYVYSGAVAGQVYRRVRVPPLAIVMCPNHTGLGSRAAIMSHGVFKIPGHALTIDENAAEELRELGLLTEDTRAHAQEHALEVQLPFLAHRNPSVQIVPLCLGVQSYESCARIGSALADVVNHRGRDALIVASTDMSHYIPAELAARLDRLAIDRVEALDPEGLYRTVVDNDISMCGFIPTTVALVAARALGASEALLVRYGNSGEASGDYDRVVGYAGFVIR